MNKKKWNKFSKNWEIVSKLCKILFIILLILFEGKDTIKNNETAIFLP